MKWNGMEWNEMEWTGYWYKGALQRIVGMRL